LCEYYLEDLTVFNDPDDDEYEEDDESSAYYLGQDLSKDYWIYKAIAKGDAIAFVKLYYETSRLDVVKILAYTMTFAKEKRKQERRIQHGRRY
jgi:hypothetical protein